jgi:predicted AlkP superfamily pyrophosphatase or phosphodiesterase
MPRLGKHVSWLVTIVTILSAAIVALVWLRSEPDPPRPRLIVLGIDGLDSRLLDELVASGHVPNFARFYEDGAVGRVRNSALGLPAISPRIWTTYVTGQHPKVHGIRGFVYDAGGNSTRLFSSRERRVPAFWEMLAHAGLHTGVVNWWFSYPPEHIPGFFITDRYFESLALHNAKGYRTTLPPRDEPAVYPGELLQILTVSQEKQLGTVLSVEDARKIDAAVLTLAYGAWSKIDVDVLLLYLNGLDRICHLFWTTRTAAAGDDLAKDPVVEYVRQLDAWVGELLTRSPRKTHFVILSDHGFEPSPPGSELPGTHATKETVDAAVFLARGPRVRRGARLGVVDPLDVLPTLLHIAGVPPATGLPGKVLTDLFDTNGLPQARRAETPVTYPRMRAGDEKPHEPDGVDAATLERLRALGYVE